MQTGTGLLVQSVSPQLIGHLVMVLKKKYKLLRRLVTNGRSTRAILPLIALSLVKKRPLYTGNQLLRPAPIVGVIAFASARGGYTRAVVKIFTPDRIEPLSLSVRRLYRTGPSRLTLGDQDG